MDIFTHLSVIGIICLDFVSKYEKDDALLRALIAISLMSIWIKFIYAFSGFRKIGFSLRIFNQTLLDIKYFGVITIFFMISFGFSGKHSYNRIFDPEF